MLGKKYVLLGLDHDATTADVRRAYRTAAKIHHPDKGGDGELFKEIVNAYETLSDEWRRGCYDAELLAEEDARKRAARAEAVEVSSSSDDDDDDDDEAAGAEFDDDADADPGGQAGGQAFVMRGSPRF